MTATKIRYTFRSDTMTDFNIRTHDENVEGAVAVAVALGGLDRLVLAFTLAVGCVGGGGRGIAALVLGVEPVVLRHELVVVVLVVEVGVLVAAQLAVAVVLKVGGVVGVLVSCRLLLLLVLLLLLFKLLLSRRRRSPRGCRPRRRAAGRRRRCRSGSPRRRGRRQSPCG